MYCQKCGVEVHGFAKLCDACRMEQLSVDEDAPWVDMSSDGRGAAIGSIVMGNLGIMPLTGAIVSPTRGGTVIWLLLTLTCLFIGLGLGIRGIAAFRRTAGLKGKRPVASLVCGTIGEVMSGLALIRCLFIAIALLQAP